MLIAWRIRVPPAHIRQRAAMAPARTVQSASSRQRVGRQPRACAWRAGPENLQMQLGSQHAQIVPLGHFQRLLAPRRWNHANPVRQGNTGMLLVETTNQTALTVLPASTR